VFVIGDAAAKEQDGRPLPGQAPAAKQMGRYAAKLIAARIAGGTLPPFRYRHPGEFAAIGRRAAVANFGRFSVRGFFGWLLWSMAHVYFLIGLRYRFVVAFTWLWDYLTFQRGARLITEVPEQRSVTPP
jgi:NADH dehydrogenase